MAAAAATGEIAQEQYFDMVINKYGNEAVRLAMETANLELETEETIAQNPVVPIVAAPVSVMEQPTIPEEQPVPVLEDPVRYDAPQDASAVTADMDALAEEVCRMTSSVQGLCIPCVAKPLQGILEVMMMWYTGDEKTEVERAITRLANCDGTMEMILHDVLKLKDADINLNTILGDLNKVIKMATDMALDAKPELIRKVE
jgi:hypothetical protein